MSTEIDIKSDIDNLERQKLEDNEYRVILFYKFLDIINPEELRDQMRAFCTEHNILGRILIAKEGVNITLSGKVDDIESYKKWLTSKEGFEDVWFKEHKVPGHQFPKLMCKARDEIVTLRYKDFDIKRTAPHISPKMLNKMIEQEDVVLFDGRNEIESRVGKFKGAVAPKVGTFRDFTTILKEYEHLKDKKIVTYCTGGIRCEKLTVLMKDMGFKDVYQLEGGIYNYCKEYPEGHFEGTCFVFDERMGVAWEEKEKLLTDEELDKKAISHCEFCNKKSARVVDDERSLDNRILRVCCRECDDKLDLSRQRTREERRVMAN